jgi:FkbM family methyltransferase
MQKIVEASQNKTTIVIFGGGGLGIEALENLKKVGCRTHYFCDNDINKQGTNIHGIKVLSFKELEMLVKKDNNIAIIPSIPDPKEICDQLEDSGLGSYIWSFDLWNWEPAKDAYDFYHQNLVSIQEVNDFLADDKSRETLEAVISYRITRTQDVLNDIFTLPQYFRDEIFVLSDKEIFADAGAYNGDTIREFMEWCPKTEKAYGFEPNVKAFLELQKAFATDSRITAINAGVWSKDDKIPFDFVDTRGSHMDENARTYFDVVSLDTALCEKRITFIKMDIEGVEKEALRGAKDIICGQKPKLTICVYHKREDIFKIPLILKDYVPEYKIYLRHHSLNAGDTVCYATL